MSKPRFHRSAELPPDPAKLLRALRTCRDAMLSADRQIRIGCALHEAGHGLKNAIDEVAKILTARETYFHSGSSSATDEERKDREKWRRIEAGEEPWPR